MAEKKLVVVAVVKAKAGMEEKVRQECLALLAPTRVEEGCFNYDLHNSTGDKTTFMFHETWAGKQALDKHLATPHLKAFVQKTENMLAAPLEVTMWEMII
ncbi:MAG: putative quinol monooxygenase [Gemmatimonadota bacterium]|nr:putative quinol monooxygenase [Gemmatimonadota bacterium]